MNNKHNAILKRTAERKKQHGTRYSLRHQKRAAHKEDRVQSRTYLQSAAHYGIYTEVDYV